MVKGKYMTCLFFLISILANAKTVDEKINEDVANINEIESKIKYDKSYQDPKDEVHVGDDEKAKFEFNKDFKISKDKIYSKENEVPNSIKVINNANISIEKGTELIKLPEDKYGLMDYSNLMYIVNNKKIESNLQDIDLRSKYVYFKNSKNAILKNSLSKDKKWYHQTYIRSDELTVLDNAGIIYGHTLLHSRIKLSAINRKTGTINNALSMLAHEGELNFKNEGKIIGEKIYTKYMTESTFVNSGMIDVKMFDYNLSESTQDGEDKGTHFLNTKSGVIKSKNMFFTVENLNFQNFGNIESSEKIDISTSSGRIDNNNRIKGNMDITHYDYLKKVLKVNLQNGVLEGDLILNKESDGKTVVTIKSMENVTGNMISNGNNDTLRLIGSGEVTSKDKFKDFEKIHLQNSDWTFSNEEYKVNDEILVENSNLSIKKGKLETKKVINRATSTISALDKSEVIVSDKFLNKGTVSFLKNKSETDIFTVKGNYVGDNGKILMRVDVENKNADIFKVEGSVTGNTGVEISSNSTLNKRMKDKLKLIETKNSTKDTFNLLNPEQGVFKYRLKLEDNKWYLHQYYNKAIIGIIANSIYKVKDDFNLTYNDHNILNNGKLWSKATKMFNKNVFTNDKDYTLNINNDTTNIFMGYDIGEKYIKYGVFGNIGFEKASKGETGVFGLGIYGTWNNKHFYADSWLNYTYLQNKINIKDSYTYGLHGLKASIETGVRGDMYIGKMKLHASLYEQFIYSYVTDPVIKKVEGIKYFGNTNLRSRLGTHLTLFTGLNNINPYMEFNWNYDVNLSGVEIEREKHYYNNSKNTFELKWGLREISFNDKLSVMANITHRFDNIKNRGNGVELGFSYNFM
ncbi:pertactin-like passenger domain-containing protein [Streptobacillus moniliformis]|uniref:pertactin-like passenger domain-containing protein n=1 Tax=Streptobacillus moniliformis TaxID=34105 RepID=UPI0007E3C625|nr:pertactin-like passenger domain-containing protein [Streptobacillus moniliformis]